MSQNLSSAVVVIDALWLKSMWLNMQKIPNMLTKNYHRGPLHCAFLAKTSPQTKEALESVMYGCTKVLTINKNTFVSKREINQKHAILEIFH